MFLILYPFCSFYLIHSIIDMKRLIHFAHTIILLAIFVMTACGNCMKDMPSLQPLVVERQQMEVGNSPFGKELFSIDIPISGPMIQQELSMDSVKDTLHTRVSASMAMWKKSRKKWRRRDGNIFDLYG